MTTTSETREVLSLKDFGRALLAQRIEPIFGQSVPCVTEADFKKSLNRLISLHKQKRIRDEAFESLVYMVCAAYIEQVVESKIREVIDEKFYDIFTSKLSPQKLIDSLS